MWPRHLAPDDADLGAAHLLLAPVDIRDPLAGIEAVFRVNPRPSHVVPGSRNVLGSSGVIDALDLDQAGLGVGRVAATLITQVATPMERLRSVSRVHRRSASAWDIASRVGLSTSGSQLGVFGFVAGVCTHLTYTRRHS